MLSGLLAALGPLVASGGSSAGLLGKMGQAPQQAGLLARLQQMIAQDPMTFMAMGGALMQPGDAGSALMNAGMIGAQGADRRRRQEREDRQDEMRERRFQMQEGMFNTEQKQGLQDRERRQTVFDELMAGDSIPEAARPFLQALGPDGMSQALPGLFGRALGPTEFEREQFDWQRQYQQGQLDATRARTAAADARARAAAVPGYDAHEMEDAQGNFYTYYQPERPGQAPYAMSADGQVVEGPAIAELGLRRATTRQQTQSVDAPQEIEFRNFRTMELAAQGAINNVNMLRDIMRQDPAAVTAGGGLASDIEGIISNAQQAAGEISTRILGDLPRDVAAEDAGRLERLMGSPTAFSDLGLPELNAQARYLALNTAYAIARANNPDGRISDRDLRTALESMGIGAWTRTPGQIAATLSTVEESIVNGYDAAGRQVYGDRWSEQFPARISSWGIDARRYTDPDAYARDLMDGQ